MDVMELRRRLMQMAQSGCPLNLQEITITPGEYTIDEFWQTCQNAVGSGINAWVVISDYTLTTSTGGVPTYILANGSAADSHTSVFINNSSSTYGGIQRANGRNNSSTTKREITSDMHFYAYVWGE